MILVGKLSEKRYTHRCFYSTESTRGSFWMTGKSSLLRANFCPPPPNLKSSPAYRGAQDNDLFYLMSRVIICTGLSHLLFLRY